MALLSDKNVKTFDPDAIQRGTCVRVRRAGDTTYRNGIVTKAGETVIEVLYSNTQNNATSYLQISAVDVSVGVWEIYYTTDFQTIGYENNAGGAGE